MSLFCRQVSTNEIGTTQQSGTDASSAIASIGDLAPNLDLDDTHARSIDPGATERIARRELSEGLREHVAELLSQGLSQSDVRRKLGISRQAVSKAKKSLERVLQARTLDAELSPRTGESLFLSAPKGAPVRERISTLLVEGIAPTEIAKRLWRFRHSLDFLTHGSALPSTSPNG